ncbi:MAG TPA: proline--tRNA ligase [Candidatus Eremiobacteraeota bacterium]|nr:MAG: Proline--tRNA ligase [bacterium ADurb.Bin363]HPZ07135.1 proline--tRNA ligase [Candidatus Eremiobacteraeota bacterium]
MKGITKRKDDYSKWYNDIISQADMAEHSPVKGCMVIKPYGYAIWENIRNILDKMFKETGHENLYFPLFIPESFIRKEADHVEGFAPHLAVVTHGGGKKLEENLIVRPTSEAIICSTYAKWVKSYRDLPLLYNQWANVVRWEMRTRLFLRTTEFLWQEGHTVHGSCEEAEEETLKMLEVYRSCAEDYMAISVIKGLKSESEKFAGALRTYSIEAMMQDKKALQSGTSHNLGQNFAKVFNIQYQNKQGHLEYAWQTSWGVSTRLIGALIMSHSDDMGLVLPPKMAPIHIVIIPIYKTLEELSDIMEVCRKIKEDIGIKYIVKIDDRDTEKPGAKFFEWEKKGVPIRVEVGPKDLKAKEAVLVRRDLNTKSRVSLETLTVSIEELLMDIQKTLLEKHRKFREENTFSIDNYGDFKNLYEGEEGFALCSWCGNPECEAKIQEETKATIRALPMDGREEAGVCIYCGKTSKVKAIFAKAY